MHVLIAEDDPGIGEGLVEVLESEGHQARWAQDGLQALDMLDTELADVIVLDLMMPRMNGFTFRARQKQNPRHADIPVVVISAHARADELDVAAFVPKPFKVEHLLEVISRCAVRPAHGLG